MARRTKGDGSLFKKELWVGRVKLDPPAPDGRRYREVSSTNRSVVMDKLKKLGVDDDGSLFKKELWVGRVELPPGPEGRRYREVSSKNRNEAIRKLKELRAEIDAGRIPVTDKTTVGDWLDKWLTIKKTKVAQNTYDYYEQSVRLHIKPAIGRVKLKALTPMIVREDMLAKADTTANARRAHKVLKMALDTAVNDGILGRNIVKAVDTPGHVSRVRDVLDFDAATLAIRAAITLDESRDETDLTPRLATRWAAGMLTGARPAELRGLELSRINIIDADGRPMDLRDPEWNSAEVTAAMDLSWQLKQLRQVHGCSDDPKTPTCERQRPSYCPKARWEFPAGKEYRECHRSMVWTRTKTASSKRAIPIVAPLLEMLRIHAMQTAQQPNPHGLIWHHLDGRPISETDENELWHEFLRAAGLPRIEQYAATRHTATTLLRQLGTPDDVRMKITGHSSREAHEAYLHLDQSESREALEKLAQRLLTPPGANLKEQ